MSEYTEKELAMIDDMYWRCLLYDPYSMRYMEIPGAIEQLKKLVKIFKKEFDKNHQQQPKEDNHEEEE